MQRLVSLLALVVTLSACAAGLPSETVKPERGSACEQAAAGSSRQAPSVRRLSHVEYNNTLRDLFPGFNIAERHLANDLAVHGFENSSSTLNPSTLLVEQYGSSATEIAMLVSANMGAFLPCAATTQDMDCGRWMIEDFGRRAFRRPLTATERARYEAFFANELRRINFRGALVLTVQAFLQAPQFLYRIEVGWPATGQGGLSANSVALTDYEMATRMSYFLWQSMPDTLLFQAAELGLLSTPDQVAAQAQRLLNDPRSASTVVDFHRQWLSFDRVMGENKDAARFPSWTDSLRDAMREESNRFVRHIYDERGDMLHELLTSRTTFVNQTLASFYGVPFSGTDWQQAELPADQRSGILTRAGFLAGYAHSTNGSPPLRGVAIMDKLLCNPPPPPPGNADLSTPVNKGTEPRTNRQLFEERTSPKGCAGCHDEINGLGYGFEAYDAMGAFRTTDSSLPVNAAGEIRETDDIDGAFDGALELSARLAGSKQVRECMVRNWFRFAYGREPQPADQCALTEYGKALDAHGGDIRELLLAIVTSHDFMHTASR